MSTPTQDLLENRQAEFGPGPHRLLTIDQVSEKCAMSRSAIYKLIREGKFPRQLRPPGGRSLWLEAEVDEWILTQPRATKV